MPGNRGVRAIIEYPECPLLSFAIVDSKTDYRIVVLRVIVDNGRIHAWLKIYGSKSVFKEILKKIAQTPDSYYSVIGESLGGRIVYVTLPAWECLRFRICPLANPSPRIFPISTIIANGKMYSLVVCSSRKYLEPLQHAGFRVEIIDDIDEGNGPCLTPKQEEVLLRAYELGYYSYPRKIDLKELAKRLNLSPSTVAELLRKSEIKLIKRYLIEEYFTVYRKNSLS